MLAEYILGSCIFDIDCYTGDDQSIRSKLCSSSLQNIRDILIEEEALVRDLRNGNWSKYILKLNSKHPNTKYILQKLNLRSTKPIKTLEPSSHSDWCHEALESHQREALNRIIVSQSVAVNFSNVDIISSIETLSIVQWLKSRSCSVRLSRTMSDYLDNLRLILSNANSIKFIDPYLDPTKTTYKEFYQLIDAAKRISGASPRIEIHRKYSESPNDPLLTENDWKQRFSRLSSTLTTTKLKIEVFIWDDFHDRYLISNLIGISLNNGFDTSTPNDLTTWTKLSSVDREDINKEFSPDSMAKKSLVGEHKLIYRFTVP